MKKLLFVYNPYSGRGAIGSNLAKIVEIFTAGGYDVTVHPTCAPIDGEDGGQISSAEISVIHHAYEIAVPPEDYT